MSGLAMAALIIAAAWVVVLTVAILLLIRQLGLLTLRLDLAIQGQDTGMSPAKDGLAIGESVPEGVLRRIPRLASETHYVVTLSASCTPCRQLAAEPRDSEFSYGRQMVALVPGREELASAIETILPTGVQVVKDPEATEIAGDLAVEYTPFALEVEAGVITAKSYLRKVEDLVRLIELDDDKRSSGKISTMPGQAVVRHAD